MSKPWADPRSPLEVRIVAAELAIANVDTAPERRAIMRELVNGSLEEAAVLLDGQASIQTGLVAAIVRAASASVRILKR